MRNRAVEHNVAAFWELSFTVRLQGAYTEASTTCNSAISNVKLLTTAATVDNLAEKVDECPLTRGRYTEWRGVHYSGVALKWTGG